MYSGKSLKSTGAQSTGSTMKSKNTMKAGLAVETMSAPNPFCPDTKVNKTPIYVAIHGESISDGRSKLHTHVWCETGFI